MENSQNEKSNSEINKSFTINQSIIDGWINKLMKHKRSDTYLMNDNEKFYDFISNNSHSKGIDLYTLEKDICRTRVNEKKNIPNFNDDLRNILVCYCKIKNIIYKQGMNEILGVIYLLNTFESVHLEIYQIFNIFSLIIDVFFTNCFSKDTNLVLRSSAEIVRILLKYHEPQISAVFEASFVEPQIYSTNWFLTGYTGKLSLYISLALFNALIQEMEQTKLFYIIIAFLIYHKNIFINLTDLSMVLEIVTKTTINTINELNDILKLCKEIQFKTPFSINLLIDSLEIFVPNSQNIEYKYNIIQPQSFLAFPIFPIESIFYLFPNVLTCPDLCCKNFKIITNNLLNWPKGNNMCILCKENCTNNKMNFKIFSLRKMKGMNKTMCNLQSISPLKKHYFKKYSTEQEITEECKKLKENSHIMLLTTSTLNYKTFEDKFYSLEIDEYEELLRKCGLSWNDKEKELQTDEVYNFIGENEGKEILITEYNILRKTIKSLYDERIKHVSFVYGGYIEIHRLASTIELKLEKNKERICPFCVKMLDISKGSQLKRIDKNIYNQYVDNKEQKSIYKCFLKKKETELFLMKGKIRLFTKITLQEGQYVFRGINKDSILAYQQIGDKILNILCAQNITISKLRNIKIEFLSEKDMNSFLKECFNS